MSSPYDSPPSVSLVGAILSYLVPGLGQIVQGRITKGLLFMVSLLGMFYLGHAMGNYHNVFLPSQGTVGQVPNAIYQRWHFAGQFWIGASAWPALAQYLNVQPPESLPPFWKEYMRDPFANGDRMVNDETRDGDKTFDLGLIYTVIAGVLNILVIYDAYAGPAFPDSDDDPKDRPEPTP